MRTTFSRISLVLAIVPVLAMGLMLLVNQRDVTLDPEVARILDRADRPPGEDAKRAYLYLLGLAAGDRKDPETRGRALWPTLQTQKSLRDALDVRVWSRAPKVECGDEACGVADLGPANVEILGQTVALTKLYAGLMDFEDLAFLEPFVMVPDGRAHRLFTLRLAEWLSTGGGERAWTALASSNRFYGRVVRSGPILARQTALEALVTNVRFVRKEMARVHRPPPADVVTSMKPADVTGLLGSAIGPELRRVRDAIDDLAHGPAALGLRRADTLNHAHAILNQIVFTDCRTPDPACVPALGYVNALSPMYWVINPVGRHLLGDLFAAGSPRARFESLTAEILAFRNEFRRP